MAYSPPLLQPLLALPSFILILFLARFSNAQNHDHYLQVDMTNIPPASSPVSPAIDCDGACGVRCGKSKRPNLCKRACGSCCATCHCVPPGTSGNYESCPCYSTLTTHNNVRKCP
ncbi:unnamed protein product [Cuscuta campestris]|nr:unnamed protein product [Cuscuta campestris]